MHKKSYIYLFIIGTFFLVMLLPLFNYTVDRWRVLHSDYSHLYKNHMINKTFLKTKYLIEHPEKYDTILMGSSNGGYIDTSMISNHTYNMKYNFGLLAIHLQNLKTMLSHGVKIKNLWIGINDYVIWKDPKDYENSFERARYKADFFQDLKTYLFYLFKQPDMEDYYLSQGKYPLETSHLITDPTPHLDALQREKDHFKIAKQWKEHMAEAAPILLHYDDSTYRIDQVIEEIKELIKVCKTYDIHLTLFTYPVFYKTYLAYNQDKIEAFKKKLALVTPFYDFYRLNDSAYDAMKWQDSMHFAYTQGVSIVTSIKKNKGLINKFNINHYLQSLTHNRKKYLINQKGMYALHASIHFLPQKIIFNFKNDTQKYTINEDLLIKDINNSIHIEVTRKDPIMILNPIKVTSKKVFLELDINTSINSIFKIYYKKTADDSYSESQTFIKRVHKGKNKFKIAIPSEYIESALRINILDSKGTVIVNKFQLIE